jgi:DNA-directed RNA polymerase specialized sigma24 family protein
LTATEAESAESVDLTTAEIRAAIEAFDDATLLRLERVAKYYAQGCGIAADDLLQETVLKSLAGKRICPRHVPVPAFLCNAMRSLACAAHKKSQANPTEEALARSSEEEDLSGTIVSSDPGPEEQVLSKDDVNRFVNELDALFADDPDAQLVLAGLCQEMTREEIQADCELSDTAYETIRKRIRRKLDKHYPKGWLP